MHFKVNSLSKKPFKIQQSIRKLFHVISQCNQKHFQWYLEKSQSWLSEEISSIVDGGQSDSYRKTLDSGIQRRGSKH